MRPAPDEVIAGARTILRDEIAPHVPRSVQPHLRRVMAVLRDGRWNEAGFDLLHENAELARQCADAAGAIAADAALPASVTACREPLVRAAGEATDRVPASFAAANAINAGLRAALCALLESVRDTGCERLDATCHAIGGALATLRAPLPRG